LPCAPPGWGRVWGLAQAKVGVGVSPTARVRIRIRVRARVKAGVRRSATDGLHYPEGAHLVLELLHEEPVVRGQHVPG
jgi:hypothetical protein